MSFQLDITCPDSGKQRTYHLENGVASIGCSTEDNIRIPEVNKMSIGSIKIDGEAIWIRENIPGIIQVNDLPLCKTDWVKLSSSDRLKLDFIHAKVRRRTKVFKQLSAESSFDFLLPMPPFGSDQKSEDDSDADSPVFDSTQPYETVLSLLNSTQPEKNAPVQNKDSNFLEQTQPFAEMSIGSQLSTDSSFLEPAQPLFIEIGIPNRLSTGQFPLAFISESEKLRREIENEVVLNLPPSELFDDENLNMDKTKETQRQESDYLPLPPTQVFEEESPSIDSQESDYLPLPPTQVFEEESQSNDSRESDYLPLPPTQVFEEESQSNDSRESDYLPLRPAQVFEEESQSTDSRESGDLPVPPEQVLEEYESSDSRESDVEFLQEIRGDRINLYESEEDEYSGDLPVPPEQVLEEYESSDSRESDVEFIEEIPSTKINLNESEDEYSGDLPVPPEQVLEEYESSDSRESDIEFLEEIPSTKNNLNKTGENEYSAPSTDPFSELSNSKCSVTHESKKSDSNGCDGIVFLQKIYRFKINEGTSEEQIVSFPELQELHRINNDSVSSENGKNVENSSEGLPPLHLMSNQSIMSENDENKKNVSEDNAALFIQRKRRIALTDIIQAYAPAVNDEEPKKSKRICSENDKYSEKENTETDKYSEKENTETDKYSEKENTENDKYSGKETTENDKYSEKENTETDKYSEKENTETDKYSEKENTDNDKYCEKENTETDKYSEKENTENDKYSKKENTGPNDNIPQKAKQGYDTCKRKNEVRNNLPVKKAKTVAENEIEIESAHRDKPSTSYDLRRQKGKESSYTKLDKSLNKSSNAVKSHTHEKLARNPYDLRDRGPKKSEFNGKAVERSSKSKKLLPKPKCLQVTSKKSKSRINNEIIKLKPEKSKPVVLIQRLASPVVKQFYPGTSISRNSVQFKILFTGDEFVEEVKITKSLGGQVVTTPDFCTHLIANKVKRTLKFMCCIAKGVPIVSKKWILESKKSGTFIDYQKFILKDEYAEKLYKFQLKKSLELAKVKPILTGYNIFIATEMQPSSIDMKSIIECAGGNVLMNLPSGRVQNVIIIVDEERVAKDTFLKGKLIQCFKNHGFKIVVPEFLFMGLLQYHLDFMRFMIKLK